MYYILTHKISLYKFKKVEIALCIFPDYNHMKPEINHKEKKLEKKQNMQAKRHGAKWSVSQ